MSYTVKTTGDVLMGKGAQLAFEALTFLDHVKNAKAQYMQMQADLLAEFTRGQALATPYYTAAGESAVPANDAAVVTLWGTGVTLNDWKCAKVVDRTFTTITPKGFSDYRVLVSTRLNAIKTFCDGGVATAVDLAPILGTWSF